MAGKRAIEQSGAAWLNQSLSLLPEPVSVMSPTPSPLTPKGQRRRHAILTAAADVFILHGYEGTTLDMIIEQSGGSRSTLYTSFGGKEALFLAVIEHLISGIFEDNEEEEPEAATDAETLLYTSGRRYLNSIVHPQSLGLYQLILAESQRFPQISEQFYRAGPLRAAQQLAAGLKTLPGIAASEETLLAVAARFLEMLKADLYLPVFSHQHKKPTAEFIEKQLPLSVEITACYLRHKLTPQ
ncbi:TetR/AcrR family transcriptional regulator [Morganella morganii]